MFDAAVLSQPLPEGSFYALLAEHDDRIVRDEEFAECCSSGMGRPSIPPSLWRGTRSGPRVFGDVRRVVVAHAVTHRPPPHTIP